MEDKLQRANENIETLICRYVNARFENQEGNCLRAVLGMDRTCSHFNNSCAVCNADVKRIYKEKMKEHYLIK